jgi:hypothetical protein
VVITKPTTANAGSLLCIDHGEYSDYSVRGFFVVLRDFEPREQLEAYLAQPENQEQRENYSFEDDKFIANLISQGLLLEIEYGTMYTGAYSNHSEFYFRPAGGETITTP